jgi:hypothetical protein
MREVITVLLVTIGIVPFIILAFLYLMSAHLMSMLIATLCCGLTPEESWRKAYMRVYMDLTGTDNW